MDSLDLLKEFLDSQATPSAIVDCARSTAGESEAPFVIYTNSSFTAWIEGAQIPEHSFKQWVESASIWDGLGNSKTESFPYGRLMWVASLINQRWGILQSRSRFEEQLSLDEGALVRSRKRLRTGSSSGISLASPYNVALAQEAKQCPPSPTSSTGTGLDDGMSRILDWTRYDIPNPPEFVKWLRNFDWSRTKIGPMRGWSAIVRTTTISIISNPKARCIYFGLEDPVMLYNEACSKLLGHRHPEAMGAAGSVGAGPAWEAKYEGIKEVWASGVASEFRDYYHPIPRGGLPWEEAYFSWCVMPIVDDTGRMVGVQKEFWETTLDVVHKRREETIQKAENMIAVGDSLGEYWEKIRHILDSNPQDFPFCLMYSAPQDPQPEKVGLSSVEDMIPQSLNLEGLVGLAHDHPLAADRLDLRGSDFLLAKHFRTAWVKGKPISLNEKDNTLPDSLRITIEGRGHGSICRSALLYPIGRLDGPGSVGFLLFGLNPQRPFDDAYRNFLKHMMDQFVKSAAAILVPEEREKLRQQWQKARDQERVFTRLAEFASVGLAIYEPTGALKWRNSTYESLTNLQADETSPHGYQLPIHPDDRQNFDKTLSRLASSDEPNRNPFFQFRVQKDNIGEGAINKPEAWRWLLAHASGETDDRKQLVWVGIYVTDITPQLQEQGKRLEDALETKRQSDNFIDMTCHEMRNPLSAIIQSADGILGSFGVDSTVTEDAPTADPQLNLVELHTAIIDSAQTILLCAQHQKRIVDDILTLSKLDSNLLLIAPDRVQPITLVERALSMYDAELQDAGIKSSFIIEQSYSRLNIDFVLLDPARLLQILINLLTNAIKFTRKENAKRISVVLGASLEPPSAGTTDVSFIPKRTSRNDVMTTPEWGKGEDIYLQFDVCDTGKGLTPEEMGNLFRRFSQASAKTYAQFGGSGLGLFISRELTELQGGQIGVYSVAGQGSTFAFYIKARRYKLEVSDVKALSENPYDGPLSEGPPVKTSLASSLAYADATTTNAPEQCTTSDTPQTPSELHILLVEDNLINQKVTANQLRKLGCTVHVANHGLECLTFLEKSCYWRDTEAQDMAMNGVRIPLSVVLLDQEMPVMDGLTCVRRIREMQRKEELIGHVPVIACTGNARSEQVASSLEAGMDEVVTKPFRINELLLKIYELIQKVKRNERCVSTDSMAVDGSNTSSGPSSSIRPTTSDNPDSSEELRMLNESTA